MKDEFIISEILDAKKEMGKGGYPVHVVAQAACVNNEASYLLQLASYVKYKTGDGHIPTPEELREAAIRTAAAAILFIQNLKTDKHDNS